MGKVNETAIAQAAFDLAVEGGPDNITMQNLARRLDVKAPSLYSHVACLDDVKAAVAIRCYDQLNEAITWAGVGKTGIEAGMAIGVAYRDWALAHANLYRVIVVAPSLGIDTTEVLAASKRVGMTIRKALEAFCPTYEDGLDAERYLRSLIHGFGVYELEHHFGETYRPVSTSFEIALRRALSAYENPAALNQSATLNQESVNDR